MSRAQDSPEQAGVRIDGDSPQTAESSDVAESRPRNQRASLQRLSSSARQIGTAKSPDPVFATSEMPDHATDESQHAAAAETLVDSETGTRALQLDRGAEANIPRNPSPEVSSPKGPMRLRHTRRQRLQELHHDLLTKRTDVRFLRIRAYEQRIILTRKRRELNEEFDTILESMSNLATTSDTPGFVALHLRIKAFQRRRNELRAEESDYDVQEDELNREEFNFEQIEEQVYKHESPSQFSVIVDDDFESSAGPAFDAYSDSPLEGSIAIAIDYSSRRGAVKKVKSQLKALRRERAQLLEEQAIREEIGRDLDEGPKAFLSDFTENEKALLQQLVKIEDDLSKSAQGLNEYAISTASLPLVDEEGDDLDHRESMEWPPRSATSLRYSENREQTNDAPVDSFVSKSRKDGDATVKDEQSPQQNATGAAGYIDGWILQIPSVEESTTPIRHQSPSRAQDENALRVPDIRSTYNTRGSIGAVSQSSGETVDSPGPPTPENAQETASESPRTDTPRAEKSEASVTDPSQVPASYGEMNERDSNMQQIRLPPSSLMAFEEPPRPTATSGVSDISVELLPRPPEPVPSRNSTPPLRSPD